jgi:hypothetical protein
VIGGQNFRSPNILQLPGIRTVLPEVPYVSDLFDMYDVVSIHELIVLFLNRLIVMLLQ